MELKKTEKINLLFDIYGCLLTDKQQEIIEYYFGDDLSLGEIAENLGTSRNAIHNLIKRSVSLLEEYEDKLKLLEKKEKLSDILKKIDPKLRDKIEQIIEG